MNLRRTLHHGLTALRVAVMVCALYVPAKADPISGTIFTIAALKAIAISAAVSAATYGLQRLLIRPKPLQQGRRTGEVFVQDSQWGIFINEVYGARPGDGKGGVKHAGNVIDASTIRAVDTTSTVEGGKGGPKQKVEQRSYFQDLDVAFGKGRQRCLKIWFVGASGAKLVYDATQSVTGVLDETEPQPTYNHFLPDDPNTADTNPAARYGLTPTPDAEGMIEARLLDGTYARIYEGNDTQLPDPLFESIHGVGSTPAYRGLFHIVFENLNITNGHPNILVLSENMDYQTFDEIVGVRSGMAGLQSTDYDYSALSVKTVRGFLVSQRQAPRSDMELLARVYDADFYEGTNGKINGVLVSETIAATIDADYMGAVEGEGQGGGLSPTGEAREKDEVDLPYRIEFTCFDPDNNHETAMRPGERQITTSERREQLDLPLTLTTAELQRLANREIQEVWREQGAFTFRTTHYYHALHPSQKVAVPFGGENRNVRIKQVTGSVPGVLTFTCVPADGVVLDSIGDAGAVPTVETPTIPANTVITLIDLPRIHSPQDTPGYMWAAAPRDASSGDWQTAHLYVNKGAGYQYADTAPGPATMGRAVNALPDVPGGWTEGAWDDVSTGTVDLFYGELETLTDAQVLDGDNIFAWGNEIIGIRNNASVGGFPNRWTGSRMQRRLKGTSSAGHVAGERVVLLNSAVNFVRVDESEKDVPRTYKAATQGLVTAQRLEDAAPVDFEWTGQTIPHSEEVVEILVTEQIVFADDQAREASRLNMRAADEVRSFMGF